MSQGPPSDNLASLMCRKRRLKEGRRPAVLGEDNPDSIQPQPHRRGGKGRRDRPHGHPHRLWGEDGVALSRSGGLELDLSPFFVHRHADDVEATTLSGLDAEGGIRARQYRFCLARHSSWGRGQQESPLLTAQPTRTDNTTGIVDVARFGQDPARSAWDEPVQIAHDTRGDNDGAG
jgi:hypothetical protein